MKDNNKKKTGNTENVIQRIYMNFGKLKFVQPI